MSVVDLRDIAADGALLDVIDVELREADDPNKPYGDVAYADPGYQDDGKKRYPIDTEEHVRAAWSYINKSSNQSAYSSDQVSKIKARIVSAGKKYGIKFSESDGGEWPGEVIHRSARDVATEDGLTESDADLLLGQLVRHAAELKEAGKAAAPQDHTHSGQPQQISDHLSSAKHGLPTASQPDGAAAMQAVHTALHGGDLSQSPVATKTPAVESELVDEMQGDVVSLSERALSADGIVNVKLIAPGWGSSGYYSPEVLKRDGPKAFEAGTFMNWDHPTLAEDRERPEGSLDKLASVITRTPEYLDNGPDGPGLYAPAKVVSRYREAVEELAPHIGVSIRAAGKVAEGERDGKRGRIITEISKGKSVDWVTLPGAGGKAVQLFEAYGRGGNVETKTAEQIAAEKAEADRKAAEAKAAEEGKPASAQESKRTEREQRLEERLAMRDARDVVEELLKSKTGVPAATAKRLRETLPLQATVDDEGDFEEKAFRELAEKAIDAEVAYITEAAGLGRVRGMGPATKPDEKETEALQETKKSLQSNLVALGLSEKQAELAVSDV